MLAEQPDGSRQLLLKGVTRVSMRCFAARRCEKLEATAASELSDVRSAYILRMSSDQWMIDAINMKNLKV